MSSFTVDPPASSSSTLPTEDEAPVDPPAAANPPEDVLVPARSSRDAAIRPNSVAPEAIDAPSVLSNLTQWRTALADYSSEMLATELEHRASGNLVLAFAARSDLPFFRRVEAVSTAHPELAPELAQLLDTMSRPTDALHRDIADAASLLGWSEDGPIPQSVYDVARLTRRDSNGLWDFDRSHLDSSSFSDWLDTVESLGFDRFDDGRAALVAWRHGETRATLLQSPETTRHAVEAAAEAGVQLELDALALVLSRSAFDRSAIAAYVSDLGALRVRSETDGEGEDLPFSVEAIEGFPRELIRHMDSHWGPLFDAIGENHGSDAQAVVVAAVIEQWNAAAGDEERVSSMLDTRATVPYWSAVLDGLGTLGVSDRSATATRLSGDPEFTDRLAQTDSEELAQFLVWYRQEFPDAMTLPEPGSLTDLYDAVSTSNPVKPVARIERALRAFEFRDVAMASHERFPNIGPAVFHSGSAAQLAALERLADTLPPNVMLNGVADWIASRSTDEELQAIQASIQSGEAAALAETLGENWGYTEVRASELLLLLRHEESRRFFSNPNHAEAFQALRSQYNLPGNSLSAALGGFFGPLEISDDPEVNAALAEAFGFGEAVPFAEAVLNNTQLLSHSWFDGFANPIVHDAAQAAALRPAFASVTSEYTALGDSLHALGANPMQLLGNQVVRARRDYLLQPDTQRMIQELADASPRLSVEESVELIAMLQPSADAVHVYLELMEGHAFFEAATLRALNDPAIRVALADAEFPALLERLEASGLQTDQPATQVALAEYFDTLRALPDDVLSTNVERSARIIDRLGISTIPPQMVATLVAGNFGVDDAELEPWIRRLTDEGLALSANDLPLLVALTREPEIARRATSRGELVAQLQDAYARYEPVERRARGYDLMMAAEARRLGTDYTPPPYSERPDPESLDTLNLLRASLWLDALEDDRFLADVGRIVGEDRADPSTEGGGFAPWRNGQLALDSITSRAVNNGAFGPSTDARFHGGITSFHLHAILHDNTVFSGPSGDIRVLGADVGYVRGTRSTDVVWTTMGHPTVNGVEDTSRMRVNFDVYYVHEHPEPTLYVVDLGERLVPLPD